MIYENISKVGTGARNLTQRTKFWRPAHAQRPPANLPRPDGIRPGIFLMSSTMSKNTPEGVETKKAPEISRRGLLMLEGG